MASYSDRHTICKSCCFLKYFLPDRNHLWRSSRDIPMVQDWQDIPEIEHRPPVHITNILLQSQNIFHQRCNRCTGQRISHRHIDPFDRSGMAFRTGINKCSSGKSQPSATLLPHSFRLPCKARSECCTLALPVRFRKGCRSPRSSFCRHLHCQ